MLKRSLQGSIVVRLFLALWLAITPTFVWAASMTLLGVGGGSGVTFSLAFADSKTDSVGGSSITYNSGGDPSIGAADPNRVVVVAIMGRVSSAGITSVTINGSTATQAVIADSNTPNLDAAIYYLAVSSGTTATIVVNWTGSTVVSAIATYRVITANPAPTSTGSNSLASSASISASVTNPASGGMIGVYSYSPLSPSLSAVWSGTGSVVRDTNIDVGVTGRYISTAHDTGSSGAQTYSVTSNDVATIIDLALAAWH